MKKITISVALLLGSYVTKAQTEYIDIAKVGLMGTSTMAVYSEDVFDNDLAVHKLNIFDPKEQCHWVKYTNLGDDKVLLTLSDDPGDTRKICIKENDVLVDSCYTVDSFATEHVFTSDAHTLEIYVCKPNYK
jgi:hypothetical protein|tara:strand:+ start:731 stop:1126 length:396 start_codon:yes stop_codon:yes gene_type:complete